MKENNTNQKSGTDWKRLDSDILDWFKGEGKGYQTRINAVLRVYMRTMKTR